MGQNIYHYFSRANYSFGVQVFYMALFFSHSSFIYASNEGKLGFSSSASTIISITVPRKLNTISHKELILGKDNTSPFCITHSGADDNKMGVNLIIDELTIAETIHASDQTKQSLPFNIYLQDKNSTIPRKDLASGKSIYMKTISSRNSAEKSLCEESGTELVLSEIPSNGMASDKHLGLLVVLISPE